ncbi:MAG TPA: hypothetical protein PLQ93_05065 [Bacteroidia bacterium]|nr:hypothetical protein [Bacteroidia bacterium]
MNDRTNILVCTYWSLNNALIQTYTLPYLRIIQNHIPKGSRIYLLTLNEKAKGNSPNYKQIAEALRLENIHVISFAYKPFGFAMALQMMFMIPYLALFCLFRNVRTLHAWCTPGGAIAWPVSLLTRARLVLDSFEPHADAMLESGTWKKNSFAYSLLSYLEKKQLQRAEEIICAAPGMIEHAYKRYGIRKSRYFVKPAGVDPQLFDPDKKDRVLPQLALQKKVCVYAGKFGDIYLESEAFDFFKAAFDHWKGEFSLILLNNQDDEIIQSYCRRSGFPYSAIIKRFVKHEEVANYMALAHFAFSPNRPMPSRQFSSPIKDGEYWAMGLPLVIPSGISNDSNLVEEHNLGYVLKALDNKEYKNALVKIDALLSEPDHKARIRALGIRERSFRQAEPVYEAIYARH